MTRTSASGVTGAVEEFRRLLQEARARLIRTVAETEDELASLEPDQSGAPGADVPRKLSTALLAQLDGRERHELDEIDAAQARLAAGAFGVCEACVRPIPLARLRARPTARLCVACQAREEAREGAARS